MRKSILFRSSTWHRRRRLLSLFSSLSVSRRSYFWPYTEDFVPKGASTSAFQSSSVPSQRMKIVREYALGPLDSLTFPSAMPPCVRLGFRLPARQVLPLKPTLLEVLSALMASPAVELGRVHQAKEMLLLRPQSEESPRLGDGALTRRHDTTRTTTYAREPIAAITTMDVFYYPSEFVKEATAAAEESTDGHPAAAAAAVVATTSPYNRSLLSATEADELASMGQYLLEVFEAYPPNNHSTSAEGEPPQEEEASLVRSLRALGVTHVELVSGDHSDYHFDQLNGESVDEGLRERVEERWERRLAMMKDYYETVQQQKEGEKSKERNVE